MNINDVTFTIGQSVLIIDPQLYGKVQAIMFVRTACKFKSAIGTMAAGKLSGCFRMK